MTDWQFRRDQYQASMGARAEKPSDHHNNAWLEREFGAQLDAMPPTEQLALIDHQPFTRRLAQRMKGNAAQSETIRPEMLAALFRQAEAARRQATQPPARKAKVS